MTSLESHFLGPLAGSADLVRLAPALLIAAGILLAYQSFRERYLLPWAAGWVTYALGLFISEHLEGPVAMAVAHVGFSLALLLFVSGTLAFLVERKMLWVTLVLALANIELGITRPVFWPQSPLLLALMYAVAGAQAGLVAVHLSLSERERKAWWPYFFGAILVLFSVAGNPVSGFSPAGKLASEVFLGLVMAVAAVSRASGRLVHFRFLTRVVASINQSADAETMTVQVLQEILDLTGIKAGWVRMLTGSDLVLRYSVGINPDSMQWRPVVKTEDEMSGRVIREGGPLLVNIGEASPEIAARMQRDGFQQVIIFAVYGKNSVIGTLTLAASEQRSYSDDELRLIEAASRQLGIALEDLHMQDELRERNRELYALNTIADIAAQSFDLDEILNSSLRQIVDLFAPDTAVIFVLDPATHILQRKASYGLQSELAKNLTQVHVPAELWRRIQKHEIEILTHRHRPLFPDKIHEYLEAERLQALSWVILRNEGNFVGVMALSSRAAHSLGHAPLMIAIGRQLAITIEKVQLYSQTSSAYEELRRAQEQLLQNEKMAAMGQLIAGVAHELNNPLTAIIGYAQLLEHEHGEDRVRDYSQKLHRQALRTHKVVQNLLSFARQHKAEKSEVDVVQVIEDTIALREYDLRLNKIEIERDYAPLPLRVTGDANQLEQVFLNILNNAVDAMLEHDRGGRLRLRTLQHPGKVCVQIHDSGPGIKDTRRIFDPFFTTKPIGKGTGLGLSICYGIISNHGGEITAFNHPDGGAVFEIRLPLASDKGLLEDDARTAETSSPPLQMSILLIDDEEAVLDFETEVLTGAGAEVVAYNRCEEALRRLASQSFDMILLDGKMPGWTCREVCEWVFEHRPEIRDRIVLALSNLEDEETRSFVESSGLPYLLKPFGISELLKTVRNLNARRNARAAGA